MSVGDNVRVLPPFSGTFDGIYTVERIDGDTYFLAGIEGGFALCYLEPA